MNDLRERIESLRARIARICESCGRDASTVEILPVSKWQTIEAIEAVGKAGFSTFGENYVQDGTTKAHALPHLRFVLIGPLQRNKVKPALQHFQEIMTLDRPELALRLRHVAQELDLARPVWIQMDLWNEETKMGGCAECDLPSVVEALASDPRLPLQGFLAIPPPECSAAFDQMSELREIWQQRLGKPLRLSMGMSDDLEDAIRAGANQVRLGTAIFGERS